MSAPVSAEPFEWSDALLTFGFSLLLGGAAHLWAGREARLRRDAARQCGPEGGVEGGVEGGIPLTEAGMARVRRFHRSVGAFCLSWAPFLVYTTGTSGCALLRDAGWKIIPWPLMVVSALAPVCYVTADTIRLRLMRQRLAGPGSPDEEPGGGSAGSQ